MTASAASRLLIEDWLPVAELGIESQREREIPSALPPINFLHVWWARRPLAASAGVVVCSLLPTWSQALADEFTESWDVQEPERYRQFVLRLIGIHGDPVAAVRELVRIEAGVSKTKPAQHEIFGYRRAYTNKPWAHDISLFHRLLEFQWGKNGTSILDPTAGGGSIPFVTARLGIPAVANDLNGVAAAVLRAGVETPMKHGISLTDDIHKWGSILVGRVVDRIEDLYPKANPAERVVGYVISRTIACPQTSRPVPLAPNWWLWNDKDKPLSTRWAALPSFDDASGEVSFDIVSGQAAVDTDPGLGVVKGGNALSPWGSRLVIEGDYIKAEAQAGRMGHLLYAVAIRRPETQANGKTAWTRAFRAPTATDSDAIDQAAARLETVRAGWLANSTIPTEERFIGSSDRSANYGVLKWRDMFSDRQLLAHGVFVEEYQALIPEVQNSITDRSRADSILGILGMMQGTALNWNSMLSSWNAGRNGMRSTFDRHDFSFKWTYAEWDGPELFRWSLGQVTDAYEKICGLLDVETGPTLRRSGGQVVNNAAAALPHLPASVRVVRGLGGDIESVADGSQALVCIDPPYYDMVMYAELSDFFGVWEQHTLGCIWPDLLSDGVADKKNEAVANVALYADFGKRRKAMADQDYEVKMQAIFSECRRVLRDDGVMTVMFTHKRAEAWDTLGMALLEAGFEVGSSWPVRTEAQKSLHQAKKNSAESTIMLSCRKRVRSRIQEKVYFDDVESDVRSAARDAAKRFEEAGIDGVDLLLSTYGPSLAVLSRAWPVYSSETDEDGRSRLLRPEEALGAAREEVVRLRKAELVGRDVAFDGTTDFVLIAWQTFQAEEFPYDEARRLALAIGGGDVETLAAAKVLDKKAGMVRLLSPKERMRKVYRPVLDGEIAGLPLVDVLHAILIEASESSLGAAKALCDRLRLLEDQRFIDLVQAMVRAIPNTRLKGKWIRPEAEILHQFCTAYLPQVDLPEDPVSDTLFELD